MIQIPISMAVVLGCLLVWAAYALARQGIVRFTVRDLFWLTLVIAMGVGWCLDHPAFNRVLSAKRDQELEARHQLADVQRDFNDLRTKYEHLQMQLNTDSSALIEPGERPKR
jgi:hypothetical protein